MLPLDLHVLSLPLAFILSQDQTLRCTYFFNVVTIYIASACTLVPLTFFLITNLSMNFFFCPCLSFPSRFLFGLQSYILFLSLTNLFSLFSSPSIFL